MRKIAFMVKTFEGGGAQRVIHTLARYYVEQGIEVHIFTMYHAESYPVFPGLFFWNIGIDRADTSVEHNYEKIVWAADHAQKMGIEAFIICSTSAPMYEYALEMKKKFSFKILAAMTNAPERSPVTEEARKRRDEVFDVLYSEGAGFLFQNAYERDYFPETIREKSILVDNPLMDGIPASYVGEREKIVVSAGRFDEQKNFELLIRAFAKFHKIHNEYQLHIYGRGHMEKVYKELIGECNMENAIYLKPFTIDIHSRIRNAAVFVQSSNYEGVSNMLLEAIAMGLPVISTDCPAYGAREFIKDGKNGCLVPVENEERLYEALERVIFTDAYQIEAGKESATIRERLSVENIGQQYLDYLESLQ